MWRSISKAIVIVLLYSLVACNISNSSNTWIHYQGDQVTIPRAIQQMIQDQNGDLWFVTTNGTIHRYNFQDRNWSVLVIPTNLTPDSSVNTLVSTADGNLMIGTRSGLLHYNPSNQQWFTYSKEGLSNSDVRAILQDSAQNLWVGTGGGGIFFSENNGENWQAVTIEEGFSNFATYQIYEDSRKHIWVASGGALYRYRPEFQEWAIFSDGSPRYNDKTQSWTTSPAEQNVLVSNLVLSIFEDSKGYLWIGTFRGANRYDPEKDLWTTPTPENSKDIQDISTIAEDTQGNIWFGVSDGALRFDPSTNNWAIFDNSNGFTKFSTQSIVVHKSGSLWFATSDDGVYVYNPNG